MAKVRYTKDHEWIRVDGAKGVVGITDYAQGQLGDLVYVELPEIGKTLKKGDQAAVVESVKAAGEVYAPVGGEVSGANQALADDPAKVNADAMGEGWIFEMTIARPEELDALMDEAAYKKHVESLG